MSFQSASRNCARAGNVAQEQRLFSPTISAPRRSRPPPFDSEEAKRIAASWVGEVVATGERSITLTGDRDKVHQAIGAVRLADQLAADRPWCQTRAGATRHARVQGEAHRRGEALEMLTRQTGLGTGQGGAPTLQVVVLSGRREQVEALQVVLAELDVPREARERTDVILDGYLIGGYLDAHVFPDDASRPPRCRARNPRDLPICLL